MRGRIPERFSEWRKKFVAFLGHHPEPRRKLRAFTPLVFECDTLLSNERFGFALLLEELPPSLPRYLEVYDELQFRPVPVPILSDTK